MVYCYDDPRHRSAGSAVTTAWWLEKVIVPAGIALATVTGPAVTALVLFARSRQRDRDMQWRTDRRDAYTAFLVAATRYLYAARWWGQPNHDDEDRAALHHTMLGCLDKLRTAGAQLVMLAPAKIVEIAENVLAGASMSTSNEPRASWERFHTDLLEADLAKFARAARKDVELDRLVGDTAFLPMRPGDPAEALRDSADVPAN